MGVPMTKLFYEMRRVLDRGSLESPQISKNRERANCSLPLTSLSTSLTCKHSLMTQHVFAFPIGFLACFLSSPSGTFWTNVALFFFFLSGSFGFFRVLSSVSFFVLLDCEQILKALVEIHSSQIKSIWPLFCLLQKSNNHRSLKIPLMSKWSR
jgi:hypothetical protein